MFKTSNDNQQFFIVKFVIALNKKYVFVKRNHRMKNILSFFVIIFFRIFNRMNSLLVLRICYDRNDAKSKICDVFF